MIEGATLHYIFLIQRARARAGKRQMTDAELINDEVEQQVSKCQCRHQFKAEKIGEGKYRVSILTFCHSKMCFTKLRVRFLDHT